MNPGQRLDGCTVDVTGVPSFKHTWSVSKGLTVIPIFVSMGADDERCHTDKKIRMQPVL